MIDLGWREGRALGASRGLPAHDLNELYCRTKAAQVEAERHGFAGMAAAFRHAARLASEPGVDLATVRTLASHDAACPPDLAGRPAPARRDAGPIRLEVALDGA